jgi:hypothetical protein
MENFEIQQTTSNEEHGEFDLSRLNSGRGKTLQEASVAELYAEIKRKTRSSALVTVQRDGDADASVYTADHGGSWAEAWGLLAYLKAYVKRVRPMSLR